ncbi:unnamed protein product [Orchesella dallaii]|uniref:Uncharacterized protein n=1 Tax=Orchesella dallaii TaxID=48710 RepID=A0ABP1QKE7_9HEXA
MERLTSDQEVLPKMCSWGLWKTFVTLLLTLSYLELTTQAFPSGVHVDGYREEEVPIYPFQQYIQVRKTYTVEHIPLYDNDGAGESSNNLQTSATNHNSGESNEHEASDSDDDRDHYVVPKLREKIEDYKKHEVYEEKGYGDSDYDHKSYGVKEGYRNPYPSENNHDHDGAGSRRSETAASESSPRKRANKNGRRSYRRALGPPVPSLHTPDGTSTKLLEYAAATQYDKDAHEKGIYAARDNIYCPEVIDFDLSSKSMRMGKGHRGGKPRLKGLGSKITCLKNKYFGAEPLPRAIFPSPSESRQSVIEMPSFESFFKMIRTNVNSMQPFRHY